MAEQPQSSSFIPPTALLRDVVAFDVPVDDYLAYYAPHHHEWFAGTVLRLAPLTPRHVQLTSYLRQLFDTYFALNPIGRVRSSPFVLQLDDTYRQPDLQIILNHNPGRLTETAMIGPPNICIEIIAPGSTALDYGDKFAAYEKARVGEYWLIDPVRQETRFFKLNELHLYTSVPPIDNDTLYLTDMLPALVLDIPTLWATDLPDTRAIVETVQTMIEAR